MDWLSVGTRVGVPVALLVSVLAVRYLDRPGGRWGRTIRSRLLLGIPWGTLTIVVLVGFVYLFLQGGYETPRSPLHIPFTSWSYFYPLGLLTAPFAHQSLGHVTGNLLGTIALAPLAEYAFSHFPQERGSHAFDRWWTNPYVRAFVVFPGGALLVGILTSVFAWGPIIGFSGVMFAFAGFALVRYPIATVVALVGKNLIGTVYRTLRTPVVTGSASPSFGDPWWAGIAIQGHLLGFLIGVVLATVLVSRRPMAKRPSAIRLWAGGLLVASSLTLWAVWWYAEDGFVLYRGVGMLLVISIALLVAGAVRSGESEVAASITGRHVGIALLALPILTMGFVAVPLNATVVQDAAPAGPTLDVEGYSITYAEDVPDPRTEAIEIPGMEEPPRVNASGVIVTNDHRTLWTEAVSKNRLAFAGERTVDVGGVGWRRSVTATRQGWSVTGGGTTYQIGLRPGDDITTTTTTWVYESESVQASPTIAGENVSIRPEDGDFFVVVRRNGSQIESARLPAENETVSLGNVTISHIDDRLVATSGNTRVHIASKERYN